MNCQLTLSCHINHITDIYQVHPLAEVNYNIKSVLFLLLCMKKRGMYWVAKSMSYLFLCTLSRYMASPVLRCRDLQGYGWSLMNKLHYFVNSTMSVTQPTHGMFHQSMNLLNLGVCLISKILIRKATFSAEIFQNTHNQSFSIYLYLSTHFTGLIFYFQTLHRKYS